MLALWWDVQGNWERAHDVAQDGEDDPAVAHRLGERLDLGATDRVEDEARAAQRTLLTLDTASPAAEQLYSSLGYVRVGVIPRFSVHPETRELEGTTVMYKELG